MKCYVSRHLARVSGMHRRVGGVLTGAVMTGALSVQISGGAELEWNGTPSIARTGGAVVEAWAFGTLSEARQLDSQAACDLAHVCELAISSAGGAGTGTGATIKNSAETPQAELPPNLPFTLTETIDYPHPVTNGAPGHTGQGACYPASAAIWIMAAPSSVLLLDIVGQACQVGPSRAQVIFTGSYVTDAWSSGEFANADGIGSVNINNPSGLPGTASDMKASLVGQLKL